MASSDKIVNEEHLQKCQSYTPMEWMWKRVICFVQLLKLFWEVLFVQKSLLGHLDYKDYYFPW